MSTFYLLFVFLSPSTGAIVSNPVYLGEFDTLAKCEAAKDKKAEELSKYFSEHPAALKKLRDNGKMPVVGCLEPETKKT